MEIAMIYILVIAQAIIIGYVAQKQLRQPGAGIFYGIVGLILSVFIAYLCCMNGRTITLADGFIREGYIGDGGILTLLIATGLSSVIILTILTILPKRQASRSTP